MAKFIATRGLDRAGALAQVTKGFIPLMFWENLLTESSGISDGLARNSQRVMLESESLGIGDTVIRIQSILKTLYESTGLSDELLRALQSIISQSESLGLTDLTSRLKLGLLRQVTVNLTIF